MEYRSRSIEGHFLASDEIVDYLEIDEGNELEVIVQDHEMVVKKK